MRRAFSLVELMISIVILSILMLFLYQSYSGLNKSNRLLGEQVDTIEKISKIKRVLYLDVMLAKSVKILSQDNEEDVLFLLTRNSVHDRINPYVAYVLKEQTLYRLESLKEFVEYPLAADSEFVADMLGAVDSFRVYPSKETKSNTYLVHTVFKEGEEILFKVKNLNQ